MFANSPAGNNAYSPVVLPINTSSPATIEHMLYPQGVADQIALRRRRKIRRNVCGVLSIVLLTAIFYFASASKPDENKDKMPTAMKANPTKAPFHSDEDKWVLDKKKYPERPNFAAQNGKCHRLLQAAIASMKLAQGRVSARQALLLQGNSTASAMSQFMQLARIQAHLATLQQGYEKRLQLLEVLGEDSGHSFLLCTARPLSPRDDWPVVNEADEQNGPKNGHGSNGIMQNSANLNKVRERMDTFLSEKIDPMPVPESAAALVPKAESFEETLELFKGFLQHSIQLNALAVSQLELAEKVPMPCKRRRKRFVFDDGKAGTGAIRAVDDVEDGLNVRKRKPCLG